MAESVASLDKMHEILLGFLECPVCLDYMQPPIWQCNNGHNICSACKPKVYNCPVCKKGSPRARNVALEQLCETVVYPCEHKSVGCEEKLSFKTRVEHGLVCPYRMYECPVRGCSWKGRRPYILEHARNNHENLRSKKDILKLSVPSEIMTQGVHMRCDEYGIEFVEYDEDYDHVRFVQSHGELFFCHVKCSYQNKVLYVAVQYLGPQQNAKNYLYEVKFSKEATPERMLSSHFTCTDTKSACDIFNPPTCACFNFDSMKTYVVANTLHMVVEITKL